ncbi:MAG: ferredoxin [Proteobacteria bacterium]|nr:ferredoxin [Pseudomonadota bacterium]
MSTLKVDYESCDFCGVCVDVCPMQIIKIKEHIVEIKDRDSCMECQLCEVECSKQALTFVKEEDSE